MPFKVRAHVEEINAFSAHADYVEAIDWLKDLKLDRSRLKKIFLVHGEKKAQDFFKERLEECDYNTQIAKKGIHYELCS
jgi:metallo-beta-lactamase family protein